MERKSGGGVRNQCLVAMLANLPLLTYGFFAGWLSPFVTLLQSKDSPTGAPVTDTEISWMASAGAFTAFAGVVGFSYISDRFGRKISLILLSVPHILTLLMKLFIVSPEGLIAARCMQGFSSGGCFVVPSMYTKEISEDRIRGTLGSIIMMFQNTGVLLVYIMGTYLNYYNMLYLWLPLPIIHVLCSIFSPESPAYSVKIGKTDDAAKSLAFLRQVDKDSAAVHEELQILIKRQQEFDSIENLSFKTIWTDIAKRRAIFIGMSMLTVQTAGGSYVILIYASVILANAGSLGYNEETIPLAALLIVGVFIGSFMVEKFGRRVMFLIGCTSIMSCSLAVATMMYLHTHNVLFPSWIPVFAVCVSLFSYGLGVSSLPYIVMAEIFPFQLRARMLTIAMIYAWLTSFLAVKMLNPVTHWFGMYVMFLIYAFINALGILFTIFYLPETKKKSIEEIEDMLRKK